MRVDAQSGWVGALQASSELPIKDPRIVSLVLGTALALLILKLFALHSEPPPEAEAATRLLSYYVVDTEFLKRCALDHWNAVEEKRLMAPEIQVAVWQLAKARGLANQPSR